MNNAIRELSIEECTQVSGGDGGHTVGSGGFMGGGDPTALDKDGNGALGSGNRDGGTLGSGN